MERYDPIRVLGEGSFGKVYLMRDKIKRNFACVKIIKIKNIPKKEREATKMEVDLLRRLHHPNIVRYIDSFLSKNNESLCICMEYCDGGDLASQIKAARNKLFSENKILHWFVQIALGLHYMHYNKVLHRDLKTQNIFLLGNGRLVLGDLGISKVLDGTMDFAQTCIGTPYYMSPEIFKNKPYSYKSDVWALGCVLYEMTTLNHAFDANSLNGLAQKIIKGRYPAVNAKYSKYLRELINDLLATNPQQRPDLDQILRRPFIRKHIVNFFLDVASRPTGNIGEGTMIVRAAVGVSNASGGPPMAGLSTDSNMLALKQQLQILDMTSLVNEALAPKSTTPNDYGEAKKLAQEQYNALKREEDHKKLVEAAIEKLRIEREQRSKERAALAARAASNAAGPRGRVGVVGGGANGALNNKASNAAAGAVGGGRGGGVRDGGGLSNNNNNNNGPSAAVNRYAVEAERRRIQEEREKERLREKEKEKEKERDRIIQEREKRQADEKRRLLAEQESRARAEEKRREDMQMEANRQREEAAAKQKMDQLKAQADAAARREAHRDRERQKRLEEIEKLKEYKLELDRKSLEREKWRDEHRADERRRLEEGRQKEAKDEYQEKMTSDSSPYNNNGLGNNNTPNSIDSLSTREKVLQRKMEKAAKDEADRLEALREAEQENRRLRQQASQMQYNLYHGGSSEKRPPAASAIDEDKYEFDPSRANLKARPLAGGVMDVDELADRLVEATHGKQSRYESSPPHESMSSKSQSRPPIRSNPRGSVSAAVNDAPDSWMEESGSDDEGHDESTDANLWDKKEEDIMEEEEDLMKREGELQAELEFATLRVEELKKTLENTKSFIGSRAGEDVRSRGAPVGIADRDSASANSGNGGTGGRGVKLPPSINASNPSNNYNNISRIPGDSDEEYEDPTYDFENSGDFEDSWGPVVPAVGNVSRSNRDDSNIATPRRQRHSDAVKESPYYNLQDPPTPSGRLSDRIESLRLRCIEALGRDAFYDAYNFLKQTEYDVAGDNRGLFEEDLEEEKMGRIRAILGEGKAHYMSLIEQLIFMEETHHG